MSDFYGKETPPPPGFRWGLTNHTKSRLHLVPAAVFNFTPLCGAKVVRVVQHPMTGRGCDLCERARARAKA